MKTILALLRFSAVFAALAGLASLSHAADTKKAAKPADLQVLVDVPPTWRPFLDDDIADTLFYRLKEVFKRLGYKGEIVQVAAADNPAKDVPAIRINLTEWRLDRIGNAQCTFSASLTTTAGEKHLGLQTGTTLLMTHGSRWGFGGFQTADALTDAANDAMRDLYQSVAGTGLVPGLTAKK